MFHMLFLYNRIPVKFQVFMHATFENHIKHTFISDSLDYKYNLFFLGILL